MHIQDVLPRDAIPSIDDPAFAADYIGEASDEVLVVAADPPRAYPVRILSYHEIVNDVLDDSDSDGDAGSATGGRPIAVTWCPICGSGVVYDRRVDGRTLTFGTSGKLADDALVMYDRETGSEWKQPLGEAIGGPLDGETLTALPAAMLSWGEFRAEYPDGVVLQPERADGAAARNVYDMARYEQYAESPAFGLRAMRGEGPERSWDRADIDAKTVVLGIIHDGEAVGYPEPGVAAAGGLVTETVGGLALLVVRADARLHAFEAPAGEFALRDGTLYGDGASWEPATGRSSDGRRLTRVPSRRLYAFAWQDDHDPESFYDL